MVIVLDLPTQLIWINSLKNYDIVLAKQAEKDLAEIKTYSNSEWGQKQAQKYLTSLRSALQKLQVHPKLGPKRDDISLNLRRLNINHHSLYYEIKEDEIHIHRVLHESMDPERYLSKEKGRER